MNYGEFGDVFARLGNLEECGSYWKSKCPAHDDESNSLSISVGDKGNLLVKCHAGCAFTDIVAASGLPVSKFFKQQEKAAMGKSGGIVETYPYRDASGETAYEVVRFQPKAFRPRRPPRDTDSPADIKKGWVWNLRGVTRILYRLDELLTGLAAGPDRMVFVCEGEKDANTLWSQGFLATTNVGGAGKWQDGYTDVLAGRNVVILPDIDAVNSVTGKSPGMEHANEVRRQLNGRAASVAIVVLPVGEGCDVTDYFEAGGTSQGFRDIVGGVIGKSDGKPEPKPTSPGVGIRVGLSVREMMTAGEYGVTRRANQLIQSRKTSAKVLGWEYCIENVAAEIAVAKYAGLYWQGGIKAELRDQRNRRVSVLVRVRKDDADGLPVRSDADPDAVYVYVTGESPEFLIWGAITGQDAMVERYKSESGGYMVDTGSLKPLEAIFNCGNPESRGEAL